MPSTEPPGQTTGMGCWTCRVRRKRCDGSTPFCETCERLGIKCAGFSKTRPRWMDGGAEQKEYTSAIASEIRQRRRRRSMSTNATQLDIRSPVGGREKQSTTYSVDEELMFMPDDCFLPATGSASIASLPMLNFSQSLDVTSPINHNFGIGLDLVDNSPTELGIGFQMQSSTAQDIHLIDDLFTHPGEMIPENTRTLSESEFDWVLVMRYFDNYFPQLFPNLCKSTKEVLRGSLLAIISQSQTVRLAIMSLTILLSNECKLAAVSNEDRLQFQRFYDFAIAQIEEDCKALFEDSRLPPAQKKSLGVETLTALFHILVQQKLTPYGISQGDPPHKHLELAINVTQHVQAQEAANPLFQRLDIGSTVVAVFAKIIGQWTVLQMTYLSPTINYTHFRIPEDGPQERARIHQGHAYCSGAVIDAISRITDLANWKSLAMSTGSLSALELARQALKIECALQNELQRCEEHLISQDHVNGDIEEIESCWSSWPDFDVGSVPAKNESPQALSLASATIDSKSAMQVQPCPWHDRILDYITGLFVHAAQIYLHVVVSGSNPRLPEIRQSVRGAIGYLLKLEPLAIEPATIPAHPSLYMLGGAWPLCVVGCMMAGETDSEKITRRWFESMLLGSRGQEGQRASSTINSQRMRYIFSIVQFCWRRLDAGEIDDCAWALAIRDIGMQSIPLI